MNDEVVEGEVVGEEMLPAVRDTGMLLTGNSPTDKLAHAREVARALSDVIEQQKLYATIGGKKHVLVEGWELLGSLLGVFPVVEWSRPVENGWEARVVAKTLDGSEVGSAEMMCTRDESRWKSADDYAIRSMAQTRAVSKSLRAPLGFVMKLAGYEPTPEAEALVVEPAPPRPFDPDEDLFPGAYSGQDMPKVLAGALNELEPTVDWKILMSEVTAATYGAVSWRELEADDMRDFWRRLSNATFWMQEVSPPGSMPPISAEVIKKEIAHAFSGLTVEVPYIAAEDVPDAPLAGEPPPKVEDVPFGDEKEG